MEEGDREYWVFVPTGLDRDTPVPLVVAIHGAGGDALGMRTLTGLNEHAESRKFIVVYPEGLENTWRVVGSNRDSDFLNAVVDRVSQDLPVDPRRVLATGMSQGALMSHRLGCTERPFQAIAAVAASVSMLFENCPHPDPVPALFVLGSEDAIFPYEEEPANLLGHWGALGGAAFWADRIGCTMPPVHDTLPDIAPDGLITERVVYGGCPRGDVRLYGVLGGGHTWPGSDRLSPVLGPVTLDWDATTTILDWFEPL